MKLDFVSTICFTFYQCPSSASVYTKGLYCERQEQEEALFAHVKKKWSFWFRSGSNNQISKVLKVNNKQAV